MLQLGALLKAMPIFQRPILVCLGVLLALSRLDAGEIYTFDQNRSKIGFEVHHMLGTARGQFHRFSGTIDLNRDHPEQSNVVAKIDVASIDTGIQKRDNHLRSADFFDVAKFPQITFKSRTVKRTGEKAGDVNGDFTLHGVTRPITLHVQLLDAGERSRWKISTAPLKRRDFNLLFGGTAETVSGIGQDVAVSIEIEATRSR
jgi:polyisoprenoid-binding protein YceI